MLQSQPRVAVMLVGAMHGSRPPAAAPRWTERGDSHKRHFQIKHTPAGLRNAVGTSEWKDPLQRLGVASMCCAAVVTTSVSRKLKVRRHRCVRCNIRSSEDDCGRGTSDGSSSFQAFWNCCNCMVGTGVLGIPYAYAKLGVLLGFAVTVGVAGISLITAFQLSRLTRLVKLVLSREGQLPHADIVGYEELAGMAYGARGRSVVAALLYGLLVGVVGIFLVLLARSFASLGLASLPARLRIALACGLTVPLLAVRDLRGLSRGSSLGLCALMACLSVAALEAAGQTLAPGHVVPWACPIAVEQLPVLGVLILAYACHGQFPALEAEMAFPRRFPSVLLATFTAATLLNLAFPFIIVYQYGADRTPEMVLEAVSTGWHRTACIGFIAVNTWLRLPLPTFAAALPLERRGWRPFLARFAVLLSAMALAMWVPGFVRLTGLVGLIAGAALVFVLPPLLENRLRGPQGGLLAVGPEVSGWRRSANSAIAVMGVVFGAIGVSSALK